MTDPTAALLAARRAKIYLVLGCNALATAMHKAHSQHRCAFKLRVSLAHVAAAMQHLAQHSGTVAQCHGVSISPGQSITCRHLGHGALLVLVCYCTCIAHAPTPPPPSPPGPLTPRTEVAPHLHLVLGDLQVAARPVKLPAVIRDSTPYMRVYVTEDAGPASLKHKSCPDTVTAKQLVVSAAVALQMRSFEKVGLTRQQAERLTEHLTGILCVQKEKLGEQFVSKGMLERVRWLHAMVPILGS